MELVPKEELGKAPSFNFAPMIDFLFLMLALFATLAISRATLFDTEVELANVHSPSAGEALRTKTQTHLIHLSINAEGNYKWLTEFQEYPMDSVKAIQDELTRQYELGVLPGEKSKTEVLLHIDQKAPWGTVADAIFAVRELGFNARPVYTALEEAKTRG
jgi:biopolymer transport protein ExbD